MSTKKKLEANQGFGNILTKGGRMKKNTRQISQQGLRTILEGNASLSRYTLPKFTKPGLQGLQGGGGFS